MKNRILAICDPEEKYVSRMMEYLNGKQTSPFYVRAFTSREALKEYAEQEQIELVLLSDEWYGDLTSEDMLSLHMGKKILLTHGRVPKGWEGEPAIYKYQSADKIIREALFYYAEKEQPFLQAAFLKRETRLYGVYSPVHRIGKTTFALALAMVCAEKQRTLYLNLEPYSGFDELPGFIRQWDLSDLLYYLKKGKQGFLYKLKSLTHQRGNIDFIMPVLSAEDLLAVTEAEWELLLERMIADAGYECVVIDFSDCIQGLPILLQKCDRVYMPVSEDVAARAKIAQFLHVMEKKGYENLKNSIQELRLPKVREAERMLEFGEVPESICKFADDLESKEGII